MVSQLWIRKNCSMFKILILFCMVLTVKLLTSHRRMTRFKKYYENLMDKQGNELQNIHLNLFEFHLVPCFI